MIVGTLLLSLRLTGCKSLKDKRQVLRSLLGRVRRDYQVAMAEVGDNELWGNAEVGVACVSTDAAHADSILQHICNAFDSAPNMEVLNAVKGVRRV